MEDVVSVKLLGNGDGLFVVLDGHNGRMAVDFVAEKLPEVILSSTEFATGNMSAALVQGLRVTEDELLKQLKGDAAESPSALKQSDVDPDFPVLTSGVVVCVVLIHQGVAYVANVGDCRAILCRDSVPVQMTVDHTTADATERQRVKGLMSEEGHVRGLMVTRSLGNVSIRSLKKCEGQIADPSFSSFPIQTERDEFILISSDGLHEVISNETATTTVLRALKRPSCTPDKIAQELVDRAVARGSCDNICACVILLKDRSQR
jgi:protein phosphatase 2C family protein 2/3